MNKARIDRLRAMAAKYRQSGNEIAAQRCEAQIAELEKEDSK